MNALHVAACCAGTAVLPDHGADFPDRTVSTCFDFHHTQRTAKDACPAMSGPSISWFNGHGVMQHCGDDHELREPGGAAPPHGEDAPQSAD